MPTGADYGDYQSVSCTEFLHTNKSCFASGPYSFIWLLLGIPRKSLAQDSLTFKGQVSAWALYNGGLDLPVYMGGRYIPQLNYEIKLKKDRLIDFEASANLNGNFGFNPFDTINATGYHQALPFLGTILFQAI